MPTDKKLSCLKKCSSGGYHHALPMSCQECCQQPALGCEPIKDVLSTESPSSKVTPLFLVVLMQWLIDTGLSRPGCPSQAPDLRLCAPGASDRCHYSTSSFCPLRSPFLFSTSMVPRAPLHESPACQAPFQQSILQPATPWPGWFRQQAIWSTRSYSSKPVLATHHTTAFPPTESKSVSLNLHDMFKYYRLIKYFRRWLYFNWT